MTMTYPRFLVIFGATLLFRAWLAVTLPITGDEAYFIWWGQIPDWGFYDHPPMIGWWLAALLQVSDAAWWLRLPALLLPAIMAFALAHHFRAQGEHVAWGMATLALLTPLNLWNVIITTDTALVFFSFLSGLAFLRAARDDDWRYYLLAGVLLAGGVLSKYFVALLGFAYLLHALIRPNPRKWRGLLLCYAMVLPALLLMAWWNAGHCWPNYMFNFVNRHENATGLSWSYPLTYVAMLLYVLTPPVMLHLFRQRSALRAFWQRPDGQLLLLIALVPLLLFAGLSLVKRIGLHWVLSFVPFVLMLLPNLLNANRLARLIRFFVGFAVLHVLIFGVVAQLPLETWKNTRLYNGLVLTVDARQLLDKLQPYENEYVFASDGYSNAVTLGYNARRYFMVFGLASSHARHDDILTDVRALDGRNILIVRKTPPPLEEYAPYFAEVEVRKLTIRGADFHLVFGRGFKYASYRDGVLTQIRQRYYAVPDWLPQTACYFCDRYFPGTACHK
ncbi:MAG: glycosyltransferase family 39 protein [Sterolibacterium sp.]|nr:glycosyltransferase family 39 protein [Sterolibacterium sp.]